MGLIIVGVFAGLMSGAGVWLWSRKGRQVMLYEANELLKKQQVLLDESKAKSATDTQKIADLEYQLRRVKQDLAAAQQLNNQ